MTFYDINLEVDSYVPHTKNSASRIKNESTSTVIIFQNGKIVKPDYKTRGRLCCLENCCVWTKGDVTFLSTLQVKKDGISALLLYKNQKLLAILLTI